MSENVVTTEDIANGDAAAALLAAGIGCCSLAALALAADSSTAINSFLTFYLPSGALSGVVTVAILLWLLAWWLLARRWTGRPVGLGRIGAASACLLGLAVLTTFPPLMDALLGK